MLPRPGRKVLRRTLLGGVIISCCSASIVVCLAWRQLEDINTALQSSPRLQIPALSASSSGSQTILLIGSDRRWNEHSGKGRSDTMLLVRLNSKAGYSTVMNVPRDLRTTISVPGGSRIDKLNAAYNEGGASALVSTLRNQTGIQVNHVFEIGLGAFAQMVNSFGCAWIDVDRRYYHSNQALPAALEYAEINLQPGYQKLCGQDALSYVRHRHDDSDLFRAARQQNFLRSFASGLDPSGIMSRRGQLLNILSSYVRTDLRGNAQLASLLSSLLTASTKPVRQLRWPQHDAMIDGVSYLTNSPAEIDAMRKNFLSARPATHAALNAKGNRPSSRRQQRAVEPDRAFALQAIAGYRGKPGVMWPAVRPKGSIFISNALRSYNAKSKPAFWLSLSLTGSAFGIQSIRWKQPPILSAPHQTIKIKGRRMMVYWDGDKPKLIAWRQGAWSYWIINTLDRKLSFKAMADTLASLRP